MAAWTAMPPGAWDARPGQKARAGYLAGLGAAVVVLDVDPERLAGVAHPALIGDVTDDVLRKAE